MRVVVPGTMTAFVAIVSYTESESLTACLRLSLHLELSSIGPQYRPTSQHRIPGTQEGFIEEESSEEAHAKQDGESRGEVN